MAEITLTSGEIALIDQSDLALVSSFTWYPHRMKGITRYAQTNIQDRAKGDQRVRQMHRLILDLQPGQGTVDHIDGNGLNNQRSNLRLASQLHNNWNTRKRKGYSSQYRGVHRDQNRWEVCIYANRCRYRIGRFVSEVEAAMAYDRKARELFGEFARLNFPEPHEQSAIAA